MGKISIIEKEKEKKLWFIYIYIYIDISKDVMSILFKSIAPPISQK